MSLTLVATITTADNINPIAERGKFVPWRNSILVLDTQNASPAKFLEIDIDTNAVVNTIICPLAGEISIGVDPINKRVFVGGFNHYVVYDQDLVIVPSNGLENPPLGGIYNIVYWFSGINPNNIGNPFVLDFVFDYYRNKMVAVFSNGDLCIINSDLTRSGVSFLNATSNIPGSTTAMFNRSNNCIYIATNLLGKIFKISSQTNAIEIITVSVSASFCNVEYHPNNQHVLFGNAGDNKMYVYNSNNTVFKTIAFASLITGIVYNPRNKRVYVTNQVNHIFEFDLDYNLIQDWNSGFFMQSLIANNFQDKLHGAAQTNKVYVIEHDAFVYSPYIPPPPEVPDTCGFVQSMIDYFVDTANCALSEKMTELVHKKRQGDKNADNEKTILLLLRKQIEVIASYHPAESYNCLTCNEISALMYKIDKTLCTGIKIKDLIKTGAPGHELLGDFDEDFDEDFNIP